MAFLRVKQNSKLHIYSSIKHHRRLPLALNGLLTGRHVRPHDAHGGDADARLGSAIGRTEVREDDGGGHAHEPRVREPRAIGGWLVEAK